jgi:hypothetical protein
MDLHHKKTIIILQSPGKFFKIKFFFSLPGEVFLIKKKKKSFYENYFHFLGSYLFKKKEEIFAPAIIKEEDKSNHWRSTF